MAVGLTLTEIHHTYGVSYKVCWRSRNCRGVLPDWYADLTKAKPLGECLSHVAEQTNPFSALMSTQIEDTSKWAAQRTHVASEGETEHLPKRSEKPLFTPTASAQNRFFRPQGDSSN